MKKIALAVSLFLFISFSAKALLVTPAPVSPVDSAIHCNTNQTISWSLPPGATGFEYLFSSDSLFTADTIHYITFTGVTNSGLLLGTTYFWQVRALKTTFPVDSSNWSAVFRFTVIDSVLLLTPPSGTLNVPLVTGLSWATIAGVTSYDVDGDTTPNFNANIGFISTVYPAFGTGTTTTLDFGKTYYWHVRGRNITDTTSWSETWNFTTAGTVTLTAPADSAVNQNVGLSLHWDNIAGASLYAYEVDTSPAFNSSLLISGNSGGSQAYITGLHFGTTYYWRVRATSANGSSQWSQLRSFTTSDLVTLVTPLNGSTGINPLTCFLITGATGAVGYDIQLDTSPNFNSPIDTIISALWSVSPSASDLRFGATYYWRARMWHSTDTSSWCQPWSFSTVSQIYSLSMPPSGSINEDVIVSLSWFALTGASAYQCEWDTTPNFNSPLKYDTTKTYSSTGTKPLLFGTTYYWRVRAIDAADTSDWTPEWTFTVLAAPVLISPPDGAVNEPVSDTLKWDLINGVQWYDYMLDTIPNFNSPVLISYSTTLNVYYTSGLLPGTTYYWKVRTFYFNPGFYYSYWSQIWTFTTSNSGVGINEINNPGSFIKNISQDENNVFIQLGKNLSQHDVGFKIIDLSGRTVLSHEIKNNNSFKINKELLRNGIYFIQLISGEAIETRKLFIY